MNKQSKHTKENILLNNKHILIYDNEQDHANKNELEYLVTNFCGRTYFIDKFDTTLCSIGVIIYLCGNVDKMLDIVDKIDKGKIELVNVVKDLSKNFENN